MNNKVTILSVVSLLAIVGILGCMVAVFSKVEFPVGDNADGIEDTVTPNDTEKPGGSNNGDDSNVPVILTKGNVGCAIQDGLAVFFVIVEEPELGDPEYCDDSSWNFTFYSSEIITNSTYELCHFVSCDSGKTWNEMDSSADGPDSVMYYGPGFKEGEVAYISYGFISECSDPSAALNEFYEFMKPSYMDDCSNCGGASLVFENFKIHCRHAYIKTDDNGGFLG